MFSAKVGCASCRSGIDPPLWSQILFLFWRLFKPHALQTPIICNLIPPLRNNRSKSSTDVTTNLPSSGHMNLHLSLLQFLSWLPAINTWLNHLSLRSVMQGAAQMHKRITHIAINFKKAKIRNLMYKRSVSAVSIAGINDIKISHGLSLMDFVFLLSAYGISTTV